MIYDALKRLLMLVGFGFLVACGQSTEDDPLISINKLISPDGHLTKTHLYVSWPSIAGEVKSQPLKLKIPIEYLVPPSIKDAAFPDNLVGYFKGVNSPLFIQNHQIVLIHFRLLPGAKPYERVVQKGTDSATDKLNNDQLFEKGYVVTIHRNDAFKSNETWKDIEYKTQIYLSEKSIREPDLDGLLRFVKLKCFTAEQMVGDFDDQGIQNRRDELASKASDDRAPDNCYSDRAAQYLTTQSGVVDSNMSLFMVSGSLGVDATLNLVGHETSVFFAKENSFSQYQSMMAKSTHPINPHKPIRQPRLDEVYTDLPKWREIIEPTQDLLDSFIVRDSH